MPHARRDGNIKKHDCGGRWETASCLMNKIFTTPNSLAKSGIYPPSREPSCISKSYVKAFTLHHQSPIYFASNQTTRRTTPQTSSLDSRLPEFWATALQSTDSRVAHPASKLDHARPIRRELGFKRAMGGSCDGPRAEMARLTDPASS